MVNPLTIAEQAEGAVIYGLTAALYGKITIKDGAPVQGNLAGCLKKWDHL